MFSQLGDARTGKLADNLSGFGRTLRRAGVRVDAARMALAQQAVMLVGLQREDFSAALEAVLVSREQDRMVFRELFDAYFRNPNVAQKLLAQMLPRAEGRAEPPRQRPRVREALLRHRVPPAMLILEITESVLLGHDDRTVAALEALGRMGLWDGSKQSKGNDERSGLEHFGLR